MGRGLESVDYDAEASLAELKELVKSAGAEPVFTVTQNLKRPETGTYVGDAECIANAAAFALKNMLGLTCDPVCGLVEVPCIKRNSAGAVNAAVSAQMAMAGIKSAIPADEVVDSMRRIGNALPAALRETSEGGLAVTESARKIAERMGKKEHIAKKTREGNENQ